MIKKFFYFFIFTLFVGCISKKNVIYFQNDEIDSEINSNNYQLRFKPDDMLQIIVSSEDFASIQPFNLPVVAFQTSDRVVGQPQLQAYLVDGDGFIEFPVLGRIKIAGKSRLEVIRELKKKLDPDYVKNPIINIFITNFKVSVQGDVRNPGSFTVPNERLSILDALSLAGDLNISANRNNVLIIREENNQKVEYRVDLKSRKLFSSPVYYLQQNDVIYVEPNYAKIQDAAYTRNTGLFISLASVLISLITIITR